jgi:hypothetical protein
MSYRIAAMVALSVFLGGCVRASDGPVRAAIAAAPTVEPAPTDPQCGACSRVYATSTRELYTLTDKGAPIPAVDLSLYKTSGEHISEHRGLAPRLLDPGKAVYAVAGGPEADVGYGVITWTDANGVVQSEKVGVQTNFLGWPSEGGSYPLETGEKRASREREVIERAPAKAKAEITPAPARTIRAPRPRLTPRANAAQDRARPSAPRHVVLSRRTGRGHVAAKR